MKILLILWLVFILFLISVKAESNKEANARRVYSLYTERSDYMREVSEGLAYNQEVDKAIGIDLQNACEALTSTDSLLICQLAVRNTIGQEVTLFTVK